MRQNPTDDELLRSYLLDELPEEEVDGLERRLLQEDELFELGEAIEADLLAAYARGELAADKKLRRLTASPAGRERFAFAQSFDAVAPPPAPVIPFRSRTTPSPMIRWASLAAALLVAVVGILLYRQTQPPQIAEIEHHDSKKPDPAMTTDTPLPEPGGSKKSGPTVPPESGVTSSPTGKKPEPVQRPNEVIAERPPEPVKAVLQLSLITLRGTATKNEFSLPVNAGLAVIEIYLDNAQEDLGPFHAAVRAVGNEVVWEKDHLEPKQIEGSPALVLEIPADRLPEGNYRVVVTGKTEEVGDKDFRVVIKNQ
jgi:hypothetical protein